MHPHPFDAHAGPPWAADVPFFAPFFGGFMLLLFLILVLATLALVRSGRLGALPSVRDLGGPERAARSILAERFARGEIEVDEFMERASVLNWTPGVNPVEPPRRRRRLR